MKQSRPYPVYTVTPKGERAILSGHPWVYGEELTHQPDPAPANGTLVESTTEDGEDCYSVEVTTGVSGDDYIEIVSGLQEGDTVAYIPTSSSSSEMGMMMGGMPGGMGGGMPSGGGGMGGGPGF